MTLGPMLTARQVQDLLDVDASTIYRMAGDGRLPAVRIGRSWRFPADAIDGLLAPAGPTRSTTARVPTELATGVLDLLAPTLGVMMVVTDLGGRPLTPVVNPCPWFAARMDDQALVDHCATEWRGYAAEPLLAARWHRSQLGFDCAHALVRSGPQLVAMVFAGGVSPADEVGTAPEGLYQLDARGRQQVLDALPRTAALLSQLLDHGVPTDPTDEER